MGAATTGYRPQGAFPGEPPKVPTEVGSSEREEIKEKKMMQETKNKKKRMRRVPPSKPQISSPSTRINDTENPTNPLRRKKPNPIASMMGD